jgi:type II secretory pathway component PulF
MGPGQTARFFAQLSLCLRQNIPLGEALELIATDTATPGWSEALHRIAGRINRGEPLWTALSELPAPFPREIVPVVEWMECEGLLGEELEVLAAWPDEGSEGLEQLLARTFAHASILIRQGKPAAEALGMASRRADPEPLRAALKEVSASDVLRRSISDAMGLFPDVFSPAVRRIVQQMEWNGSAEPAFRELAVALSRGWFLPGGSGGTPAARGAL